MRFVKVYEWYVNPAHVVMVSVNSEKRPGYRLEMRLVSGTRLVFGEGYSHDDASYLVKDVVRCLEEGRDFPIPVSLVYSNSPPAPSDDL